MAQISYSQHQASQSSPKQRITQLPGENGFHARDGSLIRKKREQWEREKAEIGKNSWFPFGDRSNKKKGNLNLNKCQKETNDNEKFRNDEQFDKNHNFHIQTSPTTTGTCQQIYYTNTNNQQHSCSQEINDNISTTQSSPTICQPTMLPFFVDYSLTGHFHSQQQFIPSFNQQQNHQSQQQFFPLPNGLIPIQAASTYQNSMPITFSGPSTTFLEPLYSPQKINMPILQTPPYSISSTDSSNSSKGLITTSFNEEQEFSLLQKQQIKNNTPIVCWQEELDKQIKEKKMAEMIENEKRIAEQKATEREAQLQLEREEMERAAEKEKRTQKSEIRDQCAQACLDGLQRAHKEAEALKRAKLYRHILLDGQADLETSKKVLKIDDDQLVIDVLRQLRDFELQKSISLSELKTKSLSPSTIKSPKQQKNASPNSTPKTIKNNQNSPKQQQPFSRANSWSIKQSRTLPNHLSSQLPVPIWQQKHSKQHESINNSTIQSSSIKPLNSNYNKNKEKTPPNGLFEQLTLRRPRQQQQISSTNKKEVLNSNPMILAKQGVDNIEIDFLNKNNYNSDKNNNIKNNLIIKQDNYGINKSSATLLNSKINENNSNSSTQSNSPGSASSTTSRESANVFKFRTLLSTPSGSQDDLFNNISNNSTPSIAIPRTFKTKNNNGSVLLTSPVPSPFSRKNIKNEVNLNKECFGGVRSSLRSPTMRRLQESLQSLSTIDDENEITLESSNKSNIKSRSTTPKPFNCKNSQYRSFNMRRDNTARSQQILEHLAAVRAQLKNSQAHLEKTISKQNLADNNEINE